jgi:hypothetical protein
MVLEVWVGLVHLRQLPGADHSISLFGKSAYTWVACWASDVSTYETRVSSVMAKYGLFVVEMDDVEPFREAEADGVEEELAELAENASIDENYCIFGTFHSYPSDN